MPLPGKRGSAPVAAGLCKSRPCPPWWHPLPRPFFVIATQNPKDFQGTFTLPDVQLDRFTMRLSLGYTDHNTEVRLLEEYHRHRRDEVVEPVTNNRLRRIDAVIMQ
jgi:MoxR-like ATPase